jgi:cytochrome c peroxidase
MDLETLVQRLSEYEYYEELFTAAFGNSTITSERISLAISQFVRSMVSYQSKFDQGAATNFANFTASENRGRQLFNSNQANCSNCHEGPNFVGDEPENNGLEFPFRDLGVGDVSGNQNDEGKFKMSSLRNIAKTAPYMHDGRFATLEEVIDHYSTGVVGNPNLGNQLRNNNQPRRPNFNPGEKADLIAFLNTLTDEMFLTDTKFSDPFKD